MCHNVDATGYTHILAPNATAAPEACSSVAAVQATNFGLSGVFDGQNHVISNMTVAGICGSSYGFGLFTFINGGTLKNVAINEIISTTTPYAEIAAYVVNGGSMQDVYIYDTSTNGVYSSALSVYSADATSSFERVFLYANYENFNAGGVRLFATGSATYEDVYLVSSIPMQATRTGASGAYVENISTGAKTTVRWLKVNGDAQFVDGVENTSATADYVLSSNNPVTQAKTSEYKVYDASGNVVYDQGATYSITVYNGVRRYTTIENFKTDATKENSTLDFSSWNPDIWAIVDGIPAFKSMVGDDYVAYVGEAPVDGESMAIKEGDSFDVTVKLGEVKVENIPTVTVTSGADYASASGNTVTAELAGEAIITVTLGSNTWTIPLVILEGPKTYAEELYFSAHDGQFYDSNFGIVDVATIFGVDSVTLIGATDANENILNVTDSNAVMGLDLGKQSTWAQTSITLMSEDAAWIVNVKAADAIIDEAADLAVLTPQSTGTVNSTSISYDGDDFVDDGYYVMVDDIDAHAEGYFHNVSTVANFKLEDASIATVAAKEYGFSGVFDGQGHKINNLFVGTFGALGTTQSASLFGWVNGGTIKNVSFNNIYAHNSSATSTLTKSVAHGTGKGSAKYVFATYLVNGAKIQDVSIEFGRVNASSARYLFKSADSTSTIERVFIRETYWNTFSTNGGGLYLSNSATFNDVYLLAKIPVATEEKFGSGYTVQSKEEGSTAISQKWFKVTYVAGTIDGTTQNGTMNYVVKAGDATTTYDFDNWTIKQNTTETTQYTATVVSGIKQYTTLDNMQTANNAFTGWDSTLWTITNGVPSMNVIG